MPKGVRLRACHPRPRPCGPACESPPLIATRSRSPFWSCGLRSAPETRAVTARIREHAIAFALAGAVAAALVWYALASVTGLIFHFMPAGPTLVTAWIVRWADDRPRGRGQRTVLLAAGASIALAMTLVLAGEGRPLDEPLITGLAIAGGAVIGAWLLRRERPRAEWSEP